MIDDLANIGKKTLVYINSTKFYRRSRCQQCRQSIYLFLSLNTVQAKVDEYSGTKNPET